jgi:hypothetical protein
LCAPEKPETIQLFIDDNVTVNNRM